MPVVELFSKRQEKDSGKIDDVYQYSVASPKLRVQITQIVNDVFPKKGGKVDPGVDLLMNTLRREYGLVRLYSEPVGALNDYNEMEYFILKYSNCYQVIDFIEIFLRLVFLERPRTRISCIEEMNYRLREDKLGYQYEVESKQIVRVDSMLIHSEVVKPALIFLSDKEYSGPQEEFLKAHEHYRAGNYKEALNECLKAFESTMKVICQKRGWAYAQNANCSALIDVCLANNLVPAFWQGNFSGLQGCLKSGIPTGRNRLSGHGQGPVPTDVPEQLVAYMLHMTASTIVFLVESEKKLT